MDGVFFTNPIEQINNGAFGVGNPSFAFADVVPQRPRIGVGGHREGALFTPGAENFVFISAMETPVQASRGIPIAANKFNPLGSQVYVYHSVVTNGLGGLQAGTFDLTPLSLDNEGA